VLRRAAGSASPDPRLRLDHAKLCLSEGRIDDAVADVRLLPGARAAAQWMVDAQRYAAAQRALDTVEALALMAPRTGVSSTTTSVSVAPPASTPTPEASATPAAAPASPATAQH